MQIVSAIRESDHFTIDEASLQDLSTAVCGAIISRDHPLYEETRAACAGASRRYPFMIIQCRDADDVIAAVRFAAAHRLHVGISAPDRFPPTGICDDGIVIDLSQMRGVRTGGEGRGDDSLLRVGKEARAEVIYRQVDFTTADRIVYTNIPQQKEAFHTTFNQPPESRHHHCLQST